MRIGLLPGAVVSAGGPSTYVTEVVRGLARVAPDIEVRTLLLGTRQATSRGRRERQKTAELLQRARRSVRARPISPRFYGSPRGSRLLPTFEHLFGRHDVFHQTHLQFDPPVPDRRLVITLHDLIAESWGDEGRLLDDAGHVLARAAAVVTVSETSRAAITTRFPQVDPDRVRVVWNGVDHERFHDRSLEDDARLVAEVGVSPKFLLYVGGMSERKNVKTLLKAYALARSQTPSMPPLVLVGPWNPERLREPAGGGVVPLGAVPSATVAALLRAAEALVLPSRQEGFGLPLLEAQACGTPVMCSDIPVFREIGGDAPLYIRTDNALALRDALLDARTTLQAERIARSLAGIRHTAAFTWDRSARDHARIYRQVAVEAGDSSQD